MIYLKSAPRWNCSATMDLPIQDKKKWNAFFTQQNVEIPVTVHIDFRSFVYLLMFVYAYERHKSLSRTYSNFICTHIHRHSHITNTPKYTSIFGLIFIYSFYVLMLLVHSFSRLSTDSEVASEMKQASSDKVKKYASGWGEETKKWREKTRNERLSKQR